MYQDGSNNKLHQDGYGDDYWLQPQPVNFGTMGIGEDPDEYDRLRDSGYFDDYRYTGEEPWK